MSIATADLQKSLVTAWNASGLNAAFRALWPSGYSAADYPVLHDQEATPGQPMPYCVMDQPSSDTTDRMTGAAAGEKREVRDVAFGFRVFAQQVDGDARPAKGIAAALAEEVMKVYGGHPTAAATGAFTLDSGNLLLMQYQQDYGVRVGDAEHLWVVNYLARLDVPAAVAV